MMEEIGIPRKMNLYKNSLRFSVLVLNWLANNYHNIEGEEIVKLRKMAVAIPKDIASGVVDIHLKNKFKKLNKAKETFLDLTNKLRDIGMDKNEKRLIVMSLELIKLFNGYFGYLAKNKDIKRG